MQEAQNSGRHVHLGGDGGDGRADTHGHCDKFGSNTLMDLEKNMVVDLQLIQSNEVQGSCNMENYFEQNGVQIGQIVTDRHFQVARWLLENLPETTHNIDVWHVAKGFKKKLLAPIKKRSVKTRGTGSRV